MNPPTQGGPAAASCDRHSPPPAKADLRAALCSGYDELYHRSPTFHAAIANLAGALPSVVSALADGAEARLELQRIRFGEIERDIPSTDELLAAAAARTPFRIAGVTYVAAAL